MCHIQNLCQTQFSSLSCLSQLFYTRNMSFSVQRSRPAQYIVFIVFLVISEFLLVLVCVLKTKNRGKRSRTEDLLIENNFIHHSNYHRKKARSFVLALKFSFIISYFVFRQMENLFNAIQRTTTINHMLKQKKKSTEN